MPINNNNLIIWFFVTTTPKKSYFVIIIARKKSIGNKRYDITDECRNIIVKAFLLGTPVPNGLIRKIKVLPGKDGAALV